MGTVKKIRGGICPVIRGISKILPEGKQRCSKGRGEASSMRKQHSGVSEKFAQRTILVSPLSKIKIIFR